MKSFILLEHVFIDIFRTMTENNTTQHKTKKGNKQTFVLQPIIAIFLELKMHIQTKFDGHIFFVTFFYSLKYSALLYLYASPL